MHCCILFYFCSVWCKLHNQNEITQDFNTNYAKKPYSSTIQAKEMNDKRNTIFKTMIHYPIIDLNAEGNTYLCKEQLL